MLKVTQTLAFIFIASLSISAQSNLCPTISVSGPAGIVEPGVTAIFAATLDNEGQNYKPKIRWTVSGGNGSNEILSGQGTMAINVRLYPGPSGGTTVTVELEGLPEGCSASASVTMMWCRPPVAQSVDEFASLKDPRFNAMKAAEIADKTKSNPNSQLFVLIYFRPGTSAATQTKQIAQVRTKLTRNNQMDPTHLTAVAAFSDPPRVKLYLVPPGATNPQQ